VKRPAVNHSISIEIEDTALAKIGLDSEELYSSGLPRIVGNSAALRRMLGIVGVVAPTDATVLIKVVEGTFNLMNDSRLWMQMRVSKV
jgi:transcriptional regulator with GAF, ATPase, and Fis domain